MQKRDDADLPTQPNAPVQPAANAGLTIPGNATNYNATPTMPDPDASRFGPTPPIGPIPPRPSRPGRGWLWIVAIIVTVIVLLLVYTSINASLAAGRNLFALFAPDRTSNTDHITNNSQESLNKTIPVIGPQFVEIKGHNSNVTIHAGNANSVTVKAHQKSSESDTQIHYVQQNNVQGRHKISISTDPGYRDVDYIITVPGTTQIQIQVDSGSISVDGVSGVIIDTGNGSLDVEDVQGPVNIHTENGDLTVRNIKGQMDIEGGSGSIHINKVNGPLKAITRSGDVIVREATLSGQSTLKTNSGSVRFSGSLDPKGIYGLSTNSGDIDITLPDNAAFQLHASTGSGNIHNDFGSDSVTNAPQAQITATIGNGSVTVNKGG